MSGGRGLSPAALNLCLAGLGIVAIHAAMIPLAPGGTLVAPDVLWCVAIAWTVRRPDSAPTWLLVALGLLADLMLSRPVGLGALALVLSAEAMRANAGIFRDTPFVLEWLGAMALFGAALAGMEALLKLVFAEGPTLDSALRHVVSTAVAYPVVAFCVTRVPGLRAIRDRERSR